MSAGVFISLEGVDGSGKSTIAHKLAESLRAARLEVVLCREPGGTAIGEKVRQVLLEAASGDIAPQTEALLFAAARAELVADVIEPALKRGAVVIADRFSDSSLAYQAGGRGLPLEALRALQLFATNGIEPDITLLFDLPVETALARRYSQADAVNRLDAETDEFHTRVQAAYHSLAAASPERWLIIDAARPKAEVWAAVRRALAERVALGDEAATEQPVSDETERM